MYSGGSFKDDIPSTPGWLGIGASGLRKLLSSEESNLRGFVHVWGPKPSGEDWELRRAHEESVWTVLN